MKKNTLLFALMFSGALIVEAASPPPLINYQGVLLDAVGNPVSGSVAVDVAVYADKLGGASIWQQSIGGVAVQDGLYRFAFGDASLVDVFTNDANWLEIAVNGDTLAPRQRLLSIPYASRVEMTDNVVFELPSTPSGAIAMWSGQSDEVPAGWKLCDGSDGTPDLRNRFVYGASASFPPGTTGGANSYTLTVDQLPAHTHAGTADSAGAHTHTASTTSAGAHTHGVSVNSVSHTHTHKQRNYNNAYPKDSLTTYGSGSTTSKATSSSGSHGHSASHSSNGAHTHSLTVSSGGEHSHTLTVGSAGAGQSIDNRPATLLLAFIIKS